MLVTPEIDSGRGRVAATQRGVAVVAAAVIIGVLILGHLSTTSSTPATATAAVSTTVVPAPPTTSLPPVVAEHDPAQVKVLVLNGVDPKKAIAGPAAKALVSAGYSQATAGDAAQTVTVTVMYFAAGYDSDAAKIAALLHLPASVVQVLPSPPPASVGNPKDATVIIVLGPDAATTG